MKLAMMLCLAGFTLQHSAAQSFDVSTIKPTPPEINHSQTTWDPGRLLGRGVSLKQLIKWAYEVTDAQLTGGADWTGSKQFDLEAKAEGPHSKDELLRMLQSLLAERFKLALHREMKEQQVYVLAVGKNKLKLREAQGGPANVKMQASPGAGDSITLKIVGQSVSMQYLRDYLTPIVGRAVVDRTNLSGGFDFQAEASFGPSAASDKRTLVADAFLDALPQLGLSLNSQKMPIEILVIDHAEEPTAN